MRCVVKLSKPDALQAQRCPALCKSRSPCRIEEITLPRICRQILVEMRS